jgi:hypothetical protein
MTIDEVGYDSNVLGQVAALCLARQLRSEAQRTEITVRFDSGECSIWAVPKYTGP